VAVTEEAARIYRKSLEMGLVRGASLSQTVAASLYVACREREVQATLADVSAASGLERKTVAKQYRLLVEELDLKIPVADPVECLPMVASRAKVHPKVEADALEILSKAEKAGFTAGVCPTGLAAAALYLASLMNGMRLTQVDAAEAAGVKDVTVRNQCKRLRKLVEARLERAPRKTSRRRLELEAHRYSRIEVPA